MRLVSTASAGVTRNIITVVTGISRVTLLTTKVTPDLIFVITPVSLLRLIASLLSVVILELCINILVWL
jgi:hypothetical protein